MAVANEHNHPHPYGSCHWHECAYPGCTAELGEGEFCYRHQHWFTTACAKGDHCQCYVDGRECCTCEKRPPRRKINLSSRAMGLIETTDKYAEQARDAIGGGLP